MQSTTHDLERRGWEVGGEREKKIEEIGRSTRIFKEDERSGNTDVDVEIRKFSRVLVPA